VSLRARLAVLTGAAVGCAVVIAAVVSYGVVRDQLYKQVDDTLRARAAELASFTLSGFSASGAVGGKQIQIVLPGQSPPPSLISGMSQSGLQQGGVATGVPSTSLGAAGSYTQFVSANGVTVLSPGEFQQLPLSPADLAAARGQAALTLRTDSVNGTSVRIATAPMPGGLAVMVARPLNETDAVLTNLRDLLFLIGLAGVALAAGLGVVVARATMRPVRRLIAAAEHVAGTRDLSRRLDVRGDSELDRLAGSFNRMLAALDHSEEVQRRLVADASHELRTPLTSLRTNIEVLAHDRRMPSAERRRLLAGVLGQLERLSDLVGGLIDLARGGEPVSAVADVALGDVVSVVAGTARTHWPGLVFAVSADESVVHGDEVRLERAIGNLVDNAAKWSPAGATVDISVDRGTVRVRDHGPGVAPADRLRVFDRFWRSPTARHMPGSGLGLAIVRQVAQAHRGDVNVEDADGGGSLFILKLPLASSLQ
jgi:two-component system sensor histidine kinase MprB